MKDFTVNLVRQGLCTSVEGGRGWHGCDAMAGEGLVCGERLGRAHVDVRVYIDIYIYTNTYYTHTHI